MISAIRYFSIGMLCQFTIICFIGQVLQAETASTSATNSSIEALTQTAQQCREKIDQLWKHQKRLPPAQRRDFHIAIGYASKNCDDLRDVLTQFKRASTLKQAYEQSLSEAQNLTRELIETQKLSQ